MRSRFILLLILGLSFYACQDDEMFENESFPVSTPNMQSRSVNPESFDWENADWMPTPAGQTKIPVPWVGQGSISSIYGIEIVNDRKASDGWELMYSTFTTEGTAPLVNPYFILYNKYRGIMRIFYYLTTSFVAPSSYITSSLSIISNRPTSLLNFMGAEIVDNSIKQNNFSQILPPPMDGSSPLSSNRWYMMQYEFAYDPTISSIPYNDMQMNWSVDYCNITQYEFSGKITGTIKSAVGSNSKLTSAITTTAGEAVKGVVGGIGVELLKKSKTSDDGENTLGLPKTIFKNLLNGGEKFLSGVGSGLLGGVAGIFNALLFNGQDKVIDLTADLDVRLTGNSKEQGAFPSSPTSLWVPGTNFSSNAFGYIPLYNKPLGVFNMNRFLDYNVNTTIQNIYANNLCTRVATFDIEYIPEYVYLLWNYIDINPEVKAVADVEKKQVSLLYIPLDTTKVYKPTGEIRTESIGKYENVFVFPSSVAYTMRVTKSSNPKDPLTTPPFILALRYIIEVKPKNGAPSSFIMKTFKLNPVLNVTELPDKSI